MILPDTIQQTVDTLVSDPAAQEVVRQSANADASSNTGLIIAFIGLLIFAAHLFTEIFSRKRIPDVLLLMIIGLILGPVFHLVKPEDLGPVASVFTTITLVIILFQSGTELNFNTLLNSIRGTARLTLINFFITTIVVALMGLIVKVDFLTSLMLGAILGGTSSAVVIPMVSQLKISEKGGTILILESAFSDVLCIVFAWAFMQAILSGAMNVGRVIGEILSSFILATVIGVIAAILWSYVLDRVRHVKNSILTTPAFVFIVYGFNEWLGFSGAIAALKTFFFVYIGVSIKLDQLLPILIGLGITVVLFALRIPIVMLSVHSKKVDIPLEDKMFMSGIVPKGLAAAVLATVPVQKGIAGGETIQNVVFAVILFSIIFTSILVPILENNNAFSRMYRRCFSPKKDPSITEILDQE